ncbi:MAG: ABC transporter permease [Opitutae bacterium]|nr:ABC transporter permease [Opitutae bacterium]
MRNDLRYALRQLAQAPGFTCVAVLTLALGIGACTAIFTVVNAVLLRPVEYPESARLLVLRESKLPEFPEFSVSPANYRDFAAQADAFESMYAVRGASYNLTGRGEPVRLLAQRVTGKFFDVLRVAPALGRAFGPAEDAPGKDAVVVLSHAFWQRHFGGAPGVIGTTLTLNRRPCTVVGVMPATFRRGSTTDLWAPMAFTEQEWAGRGGHFLTVFGRLKPGFTVGQARTQLETIAARLAEKYPDTNQGWGVVVKTILDANTGELRPTLFVLLGAVGLLLLIACANVANLLLARATARQREISIRTALGSSRWRIVRQLLTESLVLGLLGGGLGALLGQWSLEALLAIAPPDLPRAAEIALDGRALAFTLGVALFSGVVFGLAPALQSLRVNLVEALKDGARGAGDGTRRRWVRHGLVVAELALALMLLSGAGLLLRSFLRLSAASPGFDPQHALWVGVDLPRAKYDTPAKQKAVTESLLARLRAVPGVTAVGVTHVMPFSGGDYTLSLEIEGRPVPPAELPSTTYFSVSPGYFQAMGIPLLRGRDFTAQDRADTPHVAIISQSLANQFFPGQNPLGRRINPTSGPQTWREIIGVVGDIKHVAVDFPTRPQTYEPILQAPFTALNFAVRTAGEPAALGAVLRREVAAVDPEQPVARLEPLGKLVAESMARQRFAFTLLTSFSVVALLLAALGVSGVMAYNISQRTGEIGVRMALGAGAGDVVRLILRQGLGVIALGLLAGLGATLALARVIQSLLYGTSPRDPLTLGLVAAGLGAVAVAACLLPALRAAKVDPLVALRSN